MSSLPRRGGLLPLDVGFRSALLPEARVVSLGLEAGRQVQKGEGMAEQQKRLNTFISAETFKRVKLWAAEHETTLGAAVDALLSRAFGTVTLPTETKQEAGLSPEKKSANQTEGWIAAIKAFR